MTPVKSVTFVLPDGLTLGGVTTWTIEMMRRLVKVGQPVTLIEHQAYYNTRIEVELPPGVEHIRCAAQTHPSSPFLTSQHVAEFVPHYRRALPTVMIPNWACGAYAGCAALAVNQADALRVIGYAHTDEASYHEWLTYYEAMIHRFVASTPDIAAKLSRLLPQRQADILIRPNPVDAPPILQRSYSEPGNPIRLVFVARLEHRQKRVYDLVHLAQALLAENVSFQLHIIGDGVDRERLSQKLKALDKRLRQVITLERSVPLHQLPEIWSAADIFILVSEFEGTSLAMLQAMAYGCVPVATRISGTTIIEHGSNGFCVSVGDMVKMAQIIKRLDHDREQLAVAGRQAHLTIGAQFSYAAYLNDFQKMIEDIWREPPRPWPPNRPLLPQLNKIRAADFLAAFRGDRIAMRVLLLKVIARPGLRWLYKYRHLAKRVLK